MERLLRRWGAQLLRIACACTVFAVVLAATLLLNGAPKRVAVVEDLFAPTWLDRQLCTVWYALGWLPPIRGNWGNGPPGGWWSTPPIGYLHSILADILVTFPAFLASLVAYRLLPYSSPWPCCSACGAVLRNLRTAACPSCAAPL